MVSLGCKDYMITVSSSSIVIRHNTYKVPYNIEIQEGQFVDLVKSLINSIPDKGEEWSGDPDYLGKFYLYICDDYVGYILNDRKYNIQSGENDLTSVKSSLYNFLTKSLKL